MSFFGRLFGVRSSNSTRPIGSSFHYNNGRLLKVVEERNCGHCYFYGDTCRCWDEKDVLGECAGKKRTDGTDVVFIPADEEIDRDVEIRMNDWHNYNAKF